MEVTVTVPRGWLRDGESWVWVWVEGSGWPHMGLLGSVLRSCVGNGHLQRFECIQWETTPK